MTELDQWTEAVARALLALKGDDPGNPLLGRDHYKAEARAAVLALAPLVIERCAEVAARDVDWVSFGAGAIEQWDGGPDAVRDYRLGIVAGRTISAAIRALNHSVGATEMVGALKTAIAEAGGRP